ncbi:MAG: hypothetical protein K6E97_03990 [Treponema sp.]|nr:hypothetical protein [Treponema sp.]
MKPCKNEINKDFSGKNPVCLGGLGEKVSNGGTQYYNQDRVYSSFTVSVSVTTAYLPWYLVRYEDCNKHSN